MNQHETLGVDRDLLLDFFLTFARAEFALKNSIFWKDYQDSAEPDWDKFSNAIKNKFKEKKDITDELKAAFDYIFLNPPRKQCIENGHLTWEERLPDENLWEAQIIVILIRRIRNNLFHGGKHFNDNIKDTERDNLLLKNALLIIHECISLHPNVKTQYDQARI